MKKCSFTLIELLVVIGIIAILAAMLLPAITKAREKGVSADCMNNTKQFTLALIMYENENKGYFPGVPGGDYGVNLENQWNYYTGYPVPEKGIFIPKKGTLYPYLKSEEVYLCKADHTPGKNSYSLNSNADGAKITQVDEPSDTLIVLEEGHKNKTSKYNTSNDGYFAAAGGDRCAHRHTDGDIFGYMDGHATWDKMETKALHLRLELTREE